MGFEVNFSILNLNFLIRFFLLLFNFHVFFSYLVLWLFRRLDSCKVVLFLAHAVLFVTLWLEVVLDRTWKKSLSVFTLRVFLEIVCHLEVLAEIGNRHNTWGNLLLLLFFARFSIRLLSVIERFRQKARKWVFFNHVRIHTRKGWCFRIISELGCVVLLFAAGCLHRIWSEKSLLRFTWLPCDF